MHLLILPSVAFRYPADRQIIYLDVAKPRALVIIEKATTEAGPLGTRYVHIPSSRRVPQAPASPMQVILATAAFGRAKRVEHHPTTVTCAKCSAISHADVARSHGVAETEKLTRDPTTVARGGSSCIAHTSAYLSRGVRETAATRAISHQRCLYQTLPHRPRSRCPKPQDSGDCADH